MLKNNEIDLSTVTDRKKNQAYSSFKVKNNNEQNKTKTKRINMTITGCTQVEKNIKEQQKAQRRYEKAIQPVKESNIYFNKPSKIKYMRSIIDKYFQDETYNEDMSESNCPKNYLESFLRERKAITIRQTMTKPLIQRKKGVKVTNFGPQKQQKVQQQNCVDKKTISNFLPPIHEEFNSHEYVREDNYLSMTISYTQDFRKQQKMKEIICIHHCEIYTLNVVLESNQPIYRVKQFSQKGMEILYREQKITHYLPQQSIMWHMHPNDFKCMILPNNNPLKNLLMKMVIDHQHKGKLKIKPKHLYRQLMNNQCNQLLKMVRNLCILLQKLQGRIKNNKINLSNLFLHTNNFYLMEWGYSSYRQISQIQGNIFESRTQPLLKTDNQWLVTPEYLAPEILMIMQDAQYKLDLWQNGSASDVWSLGLSLFQMLTLIPIWAQEKCYVGTKRATSRAGVMGIGTRDINMLIKRQHKLKIIVAKCLQNELEDNSNPLVKLIPEMLEVNPSKRPTLQEIVDKLHY